MEAERLRRAANIAQSVTNVTQNKIGSTTKQNIATNSTKPESNNIINKPNTIEQSKQIQTETKEIVSIIFNILILSSL